MNPAALVLAAGLGTRMRATKALLDIDGLPALVRVLKTIDAAGVAPVVVVLGRDAAEIEAHVDLSERRVVVNPAPERGLSSSLALGLAAVPADASGALVFHADMPFVRAETVVSVVAALRPGTRLAAPQYAGARGFPVYLGRETFAALCAELAGDAGARDYLARHSECLARIDVDDPGCVRDLDRPEDLAACREEASWTTCA